MLLILGFFMGIFLATFSVAASSLFIDSSPDELPVAILSSGVLGIVATSIYNYFQSKIRFSWLASISLILITVLAAGLEMGLERASDPKPFYFAAFICILPFSYIMLLIFWGIFGRLFNLRQSKRIIGSIDTGQLVASIIALFSIPLILRNEAFKTTDLFTISLSCVIGYLVVLLFISNRFRFKESNVEEGKRAKNRLSYVNLIKNKYMGLMALFIVISMVTVTFIDYSFLTATSEQFEAKELANFLSLFEAAVVVFSFLFQTFVTDRIIALYGLRVALIINPILIVILTGITLIIGLTFGYTKEDNDFFLFFLLFIAMSKLFVDSLKDALDGPSFKLYFLPVSSDIRFDVQTKIEGVITAFAGLIAGGLILLISNIGIFGLIYITVFTLPLLGLWYWTTNRMHHSYKDTLRETLESNKDEKKSERQYAIDRVLENEINSGTEEKILYGLKLMEKLEPAMFETSIVKFLDSRSLKIRDYAKSKVKTLDVDFDRNNEEVQRLAFDAKDYVEDSEIISVSSDKLWKLSKSIKREDRILAAKLLRRLTEQKNIFVLLELLRDADPKVRKTAIVTARKVKKPETWGILIELLNSPTFNHAASEALRQSGEEILPYLETAFHKSGQTYQVMLRIVQIIGRIGGPQAMQLLWKKIDYPDRKIVRQILLSFRYFNYQAKDTEIQKLTDLLEEEIAKSLWNLTSLTEIPKEDHFHYLREAIHQEVLDNFDQIFILLSIIYDPQSVQLVRENVESETEDGTAFALELLDIFLAPELKPKLFPLFDDISVAEKLRQLQVHFPRQQYELHETLNFLLNRNFNQTNRWTKACVLHAIAFMNDFGVTRPLIAQMFNPDRFLQETASWVIYHKDPPTFTKVSKRLSEEDRRFLVDSISKNSLEDGLDDGFYLNIEMAMLFKKIPVFANIKGTLICNLVDKMNTINLEKYDQITLDINEDNKPIFIIAEGLVSLRDGEVEKGKLKERELFGELFIMGSGLEVSTIKALERTVIFEINTNDFYTVMADDHELAHEFINNVSMNLVAETINELK